MDTRIAHECKGLTRLLVEHFRPVHRKLKPATVATWRQRKAKQLTEAAWRDDAFDERPLGHGIVQYRAKLWARSIVSGMVGGGKDSEDSKDSKDGGDAKASMVNAEFEKVPHALRDRVTEALATLDEERAVVAITKLLMATVTAQVQASDALGPVDKDTMPNAEPDPRDPVVNPLPVHFADYGVSWHCHFSAIQSVLCSVGAEFRCLHAPRTRAAVARRQNNIPHARQVDCASGEARAACERCRW